MLPRKIIVLSTLLASSTTLAQEDWKPGFLAGIGIGQATASIEDEELDVSLEGHDTAFKIFAGYQFTPYISGEFAYHSFGEPSDTIEDVRVSVEGTGFEGSVILSTTIDRPFGVFGRAGYVAWDAKISATDGTITISDSDDGNDASYGVGIWGKLENALLRVEYSKTKFSEIDVDLINASIVWRF